MPLHGALTFFLLFLLYMTLAFEIATYYMWWKFNVARGGNWEKESDTSFPATVWSGKNWGEDDSFLKNMN